MGFKLTSARLVYKTWMDDRRFFETKADRMKRAQRERKKKERVLMKEAREALKKKPKLVKIEEPEPEASAHLKEEVKSEEVTVPTQDPRWTYPFSSDLLVCIPYAGYCVVMLPIEFEPYSSSQEAETVGPKKNITK
jgi:hypothetical protein